MVVQCFQLLSFALLWYIDIRSFSSFVLSWLGFLPPQFAMTVITCVKCYLFMPIPPTEDDFTLQVNTKHNRSSSTHSDLAEGIHMG